MKKKRKGKKKGRKGKEKGKKRGEGEDLKTLEKIKGMKTIRKKKLEVIYNLQPYST
jgi:hypothetical protein